MLLCFYRENIFTEIHEKCYNYIQIYISFALKIFTHWIFWKIFKSSFSHNSVSVPYNSFSWFLVAESKSKYQEFMQRIWAIHTILFHLLSTAIENSIKRLFAPVSPLRDWSLLSRCLCPQLRVWGAKRGRSVQETRPMRTQLLAYTTRTYACELLSTTCPDSKFFLTLTKSSYSSIFTSWIYTGTLYYRVSQKNAR